MKKAAISAFFCLSDRTVGQFLEALIADNLIRSLWYPLDVEALVLLHELEVQEIAIRETVDAFDTLGAAIGLIGEIGSLHEGHAFLPLEDAGVEAVEIVAVAPFPDKLSRVL